MGGAQAADVRFLNTNVSRYPAGMRPDGVERATVSGIRGHNLSGDSGSWRPFGTNLTPTLAGGPHPG